MFVLRSVQSHYSNLINTLGGPNNDDGLFRAVFCGVMMLLFRLGECVNRTPINKTNGGEHNTEGNVHGSKGSMPERAKKLLPGAQ